MAKRISSEKEKAIIQAVKAGDKTYKEIADEFNISKGTVHNIMKRNNIDTERFRIKKADEARSRWCKQRRFELIGMFFDKYKEMLQKVKDPRELKDLMMAFGIAVDKVRLEEGDVTERTETRGEMDVRNHDIDKKLQDALATVEKVVNNYIPGDDTKEQVDTSRTV